MKRLVALMAVWLVPTLAQAERSGAVALLPGTTLGLALEQTNADSPSFVGADRIRRTALWLHVRGGVVQTNSSSDRGSQLGVQYRLRVGVTPPDTPGGDEAPFGLGAELQLVNRAYTFQWPAEGVIAVHTGIAFDVGGGHWWSDGARFSFLGGARLAMASAEDTGLEFDYTLVPYIFGSTPGSLDISRTEHRFSATIRGGEIGLGVWATWFVERTRPEGVGPTTRVVGSVLGVGMEWR